ncbi:hypothetical protein BH10CYA1_BH10CYA1_61760 [soil metagenome]
MIRSTAPAVSYIDQPRFTRGLASGEIHKPIVFACSDMGWTLPRIPHDSDVLIFQNFGHQMCPSELSRIIRRTNSNHVLLYGHTDCKFLEWLLDSRSSEEMIHQVLMDRGSRSYVESVRHSNCKSTHDLAQWLLLRHLTLLQQSNAVKTSAGHLELQLHAWLFIEPENKLRVYDPLCAKFVDS